MNNKNARTEPTTETPDPRPTMATVAAPINPIFTHFRIEDVLIAHDPKTPDAKPWSDGTICQTLAAVILVLADCDVTIPNCRIVKKTRNNAVTLDLMLPSASRAGGAYHESFLKASKGTEAYNNLEAFKNAVVRRYMDERIEAVKRGAASVSKMTPAGVHADAQLLADLGITV